MSSSKSGTSEARDGVPFAMEITNTAASSLGNDASVTDVCLYRMGSRGSDAFNSRLQSEPRRVCSPLQKGHGCVNEVSTTVDTGLTVGHDISTQWSIL